MSTGDALEGLNAFLARRRPMGGRTQRADDNGTSAWNPSSAARRCSKTQLRRGAPVEGGRAGPQGRRLHADLCAARDHPRRRRLPLGIVGGGDQIEVIHGDAYYQSYICRIPRSTIELGSAAARLRRRHAVSRRSAT
jgi:hypothetical protein